jgi:hypothetical protein
VDQRIPGRASGLAGQAGPSTSEGSAAGSQQADEGRAVGRRALLTRGGVVVAGVVGAGVAGAAAAAPASAATGAPVVQGQSNNVGTNQPATEITVGNDPATPTPTAVLTNTGVNATTGEASPSLRLTPATSSAPLFPASATVGGDLVATNDGNLWFTHAIPTVGPIAAPVHTDANSNSFVPLAAPTRMLDTRSTSGRANVLDPSGNLDSSGRLLGGKTIHINLSSLVFFGDAVTATLSAITPTATGFMILWSGAVAKPTAVSLNFIVGQSISNLTVSALAAFSQTATDTIAIHTTKTTHVLLDVAGFTVRNFGQVNPAFTAPTMSGTARAQRAKQALAKLRSQHR